MRSKWGRSEAKAGSNWNQTLTEVTWQKYTPLDEINWQKYTLQMKEIDKNIPLCVCTHVYYHACQ